MRSAALRGKVALSEDLLTASWFDLLDAQTDLRLLRGFLALARLVGPDGRCGPVTLLEHLALGPADRADCTLWPRWASGEPDALVDLRSDGRRRARLVVEVKAGAPKGAGPVDVPDPSGAPGWDQLAGYLGEACERAGPDERVALLYLTHHPVAPCDELAATLQRPRGAASDGAVAWAAWRDVEALLARGDGPAWAPANDVRDHLALLGAFGFCRFAGRWRAGSASVPPARSTFPTRRQRPVPGARGHGWRAGAGLPALTGPLFRSAGVRARRGWPVGRLAPLPASVFRSWSALP